MTCLGIDSQMKMFYCQSFSGVLNVFLLHKVCNTCGLADIFEKSFHIALHFSAFLRIYLR